MDKYYQIAMDGPAGAGKSTLAKRLARELGFTFINSGGMYRCFAIAIRDNGSDYSNIPEVIKAIKGADVSQIGTKMLLNNIDVTQKCYTPEITLLVPEISKIKEVRDECHDAQLRLATGTNIVIEGRDTTTVMFPDATLKVFVTASSELRAQRR
jgi:cytidylate kinase